MPPARSSLKPTANYETIDLNSADGIIEFFKREVSSDFHGKEFSYKNLMPDDRIQRRQALQKIDLIVGHPMLVGTPRITKDIIPILKLIQSENPNDYETAFFVIKAYLDCKKYGTGKNTNRIIVPLLLSYLEMEESEVRVAALDGIRQIIKNCPKTEANKLFGDTIITTLKSLAKDQMFQCRDSACSLAAIFYPGLPEVYQAELRELMVNSIFDESIVVQASAANALLSIVKSSPFSILSPEVALPDIAPLTDDLSFYNVAIFLPYKNTIHSHQKCRLLKVIKELTRKLPKSIQTKSIIPLLTESLTDTSQVVRAELTELLPLFMSELSTNDSSIVEAVIVPTFLKLLKDPIPEIRDKALISIRTCFDPQADVRITYFLCENYMAPLKYDELVTRRFTAKEGAKFLGAYGAIFLEDGFMNSNQRLKAIGMMSRMIDCLDFENVEKFLLPLAISILKTTESQEEMTEAAIQSIAFYKKLNIKDIHHPLVQAIFASNDDTKQENLTLIPVLGNSTAWRTRCAICSHIIVLAENMPSHQADPNQLVACLEVFMKDDVAAVRRSALQASAELVRIFGLEFFYQVLLERIMVLFRVKNPLKSTSVFAWRHICYLIEYAAPYITAYDPKLGALLSKFLQDKSVSGLRIAAIQSIKALLDKSGIDETVRRQEFFTQALFLSPKYSSSQALPCAEMSDDVKIVADELYLHYR